MKFAMLAVLILPLAILLLHRHIGDAAALALSQASPMPGHTASPEILYAYSSAVGNNGSAFAGLNANTPWFNTTLGIAMMAGRFGYVVPVMAIADRWRRKSRFRIRPAHSRLTKPCSSAFSSASS